MDKPLAIIKVDKDNVSIFGKDGNLMTRFWVKETGIKEGYEQPCVPVDVIHEIKHLQELGFDIEIQ